MTFQSRSAKVDPANIHKGDCPKSPVAYNINAIFEFQKATNACAFCFCLGVSRPFVSDTSPKRIDREGLGKRRTRTRQSILDVGAQYLSEALNMNISCMGLSLHNIGHLGESDDLPVVMSSVLHSFEAKGQHT